MADDSSTKPGGEAPAEGTAPAQVADDPALGTVRDGWIDVGRDDVAEGELRALEVDRTHVLLTRLEGALLAIDDCCNHAGCLLSGGWLDRKLGSVICPCHEYEFELRSGKNLTFPRMCEDQESFPAKTEQGRALIRLGDR